MSLSLIIAVTFAIVIVLIALSCTVFYIYLRRRVAEQENIQQNQALHLYDCVRHVKDLMASDQFKEDDKKGIDIPIFNFKSILTATDNFSCVNKIGEGGFGPVYKGKFSGGQEIAVMRFSRKFAQAYKVFAKEAVLIAKLQHWNLVRLLGYCVKGDETILLYEYMPNKNLDRFIFDRAQCVVLNWELRFNIILGIARGLLYLHQDFGFKLIHGNLKTSNILLDDEWNPKISDFGLARIFGGTQTGANIDNISGTYGYMSPEYLSYGFVSIKSDIFSFGVVVLEILSGKKNNERYPNEYGDAFLHDYAWQLWNEDKALDLMDQTLYESCNTTEFLKCVNVGLLCVQDDPSDRPTMSNIVSMLGCETATLPTPKQQTLIRRDRSSMASSSGKPETWSQNELTITVEEGR